MFINYKYFYFCLEAGRQVFLFNHGELTCYLLLNITRRDINIDSPYSNNKSFKCVWLHSNAYLTLSIQRLVLSGYFRELEFLFKIPCGDSNTITIIIQWWDLTQRIMLHFYHKMWNIYLYCIEMGETPRNFVLLNAWLWLHLSWWLGLEKPS